MYVISFACVYVCRVQKRASDTLEWIRHGSLGEGLAQALCKQATATSPVPQCRLQYKGFGGSVWCGQTHNNELGNGICMSPEVEMIELGHNMKVTFKEDPTISCSSVDRLSMLQSGQSWKMLGSRKRILVTMSCVIFQDYSRIPSPKTP